MRLRLLTLALLCAVDVFAQLPLPKPPDLSPPKTGDPLGRENPRSSLIGFLSSGRAGRFTAAAQYLEMPARERERRGPELARMLTQVVDLSFRGNLDEISRSPEGSLNDGGDQEIVGRLATAEGSVDLVLKRVTDPAYGPVWLIAADVVRQIPQLYEKVGYIELEKRLPAWAVETRLFGVALWLWVLIVLLLVLSLLVAMVLGTLVFWGYRKFRSSGAMDWLTWKKEALPFIFLIAFGLHAAVVTNLRGLPILYRQYYSRLISIVTISLVAWAIFRLIDSATRRAGALMAEHGQTSGQALLVLGKRVLKAIVLGFAGLAVLQALGYNTAPLLAGLGIGGVALALASQKTIENLFGGISVLGDSSIRVGDFCRVGTLAGSIEDIGLRATRLRTVDRSVVSIPNSVLYTSNVENLGMRDKILFRHTIGVRYETTADQLRFLLARIRQLFIEHPMVETETCRVRLLRFGDSAIEFEAWAYVLTNQFPEFLAVQEDLLLRMMDLIEEAGTSVAFPSQTLYLRRDTGLDEQQRSMAEQIVNQWRVKRELPFPDFAPERISETRNRIPYPPLESAVRPPDSTPSPETGLTP
jgi:MscS family membrane protein